MQCPACGHELVEVMADNLTVDVCKNGCAGIWFDNFELQKVDEKQEAAGEFLLQFEKRNNIVIDYTQPRLCPKCDKQIMMKHFMSIKREVEIDECPACGGIWLDMGELGKIRKQFDTDQQRRFAAEQYFQETFGGELVSMRTANEIKLQKAQRLKKSLRFVCPSFFLPNIKDWLAF